MREMAASEKFRNNQEGNFYRRERYISIPLYRCLMRVPQGMGKVMPIETGLML